LASKGVSALGTVLPTKKGHTRAKRNTAQGGETV